MADQQHSGQFAGCMALVTGACGGLGAAVVRALAGRGATVIAVDVNEQGLQQLATGAEGIHPLHMNLADPASIVRGVDIVLREHGQIDILAHMAIRHIAGDDGFELRAFTNHTPEQVLETLAVAVTGPTLLTQHVCKTMVERKSGQIVFTGSMLRTGTGGIVMYTAGKAYITALARGLFAELRQHNIRTLAVHPGGMHTGMHQFRDPWMLEPAVVAEAIVEQLALPKGLAVLSFEIVPHDPEHPDAM